VTLAAAVVAVFVAAGGGFSQREYDVQSSWTSMMTVPLVTKEVTSWLTAPCSRHQGIREGVCRLLTEHPIGPLLTAFAHLQHQRVLAIKTWEIVYCGTIHNSQVMETAKMPQH
jgi:hypothetical protein